MKIFTFNDFVCPVDGLLLKGEKTLRCESGHSYDVAREGYCNLLLVQEKATLQPGDNKEMVSSRGRFLDSGHFAPIADKLFEMVQHLAALSNSDRPLRIVDAGCGEGYYLNELLKRASASKAAGELALAGFDISKWAVKAAAKRTNRISWAVAGNRRVPFAKESVDIILSMFGFADWKSFKSALRKEGHVLTVDPGHEHLIELRKIIYPVLKAKDTPDGAVPNGYVLERKEVLRFSINLTSPSMIQDLLSMTPHAFRIKDKARQELQAMKHLTVTVDVVYKIFKIK